MEGINEKFTLLVEAEGLSPQAALFATMEAQGWTKIVVEFSGGNDEGGPDDYQFWRGDEQIESAPGWQQAGGIDVGDGPFWEEILRPVYHEYGGFNGDGVAGSLTYDLTTRKATMSADVQDWVHQGETDVTEVAR